MTITVQNGSKGVSGGAASAATAAKNTNATGSGFFLGAIWDRAQTLTITDNAGNNTALASSLVGAEIDDNSGGLKTRIMLLPNGLGRSGHIFTGTMSGAGVLSLFSGEFATTNGNGVTLDQSNQGNPVASPFGSGNIVTTIPIEVLLSLIGGNSGSNPATHAESTGFSLLTNAEELNGSANWTGCLASRVVSSTGTYAASWTESGCSRSGVHIFSVSEAAGGAAPLGQPWQTQGGMGVMVAM